MKSESDSGTDKTIFNPQKTPKIYSINRKNKERKFDRRTFLGMTPAAAGTALVTAKTISKNPDDLKPSARPKRCQKASAYTGTIFKIALNSDESLMVATGIHEDECTKLWSVTSGNLIKKFEDDSGIDLKFSPDDNWILVGGASQKIQMWNIDDEGKSKTFSKHSGIIYGFTFLPDGKSVVSTSRNETLIWSFPRGKVIKSFHPGPELQCVAYSPDKTIMAVGNRYNELRMLSLKDGEEGTLLRKIRNGTEGRWGIRVVAFSPDGKYLVSVGNDIKSHQPVVELSQIKIWSVRTGKLKKTILAHKGGVLALDFTPDSKEMISCGKYGWITVWNFPDGKLLRTFEKKKKEWQKGAKSFKFIAEGKILVVGYQYGEIRFLDYKKAKLKRCLVDLDALKTTQWCVQYKYKSKSAEWITLTVPNCKCAPKMPKDAVCTCDTIAGTGCTCDGHGCSVVSHYWHPN